MKQAELKSVLAAALKGAARGATRAPSAEHPSLRNDELALVHGGAARPHAVATSLRLPVEPRRAISVVLSNPIDPRPPEPPPPDPTPPDFTEAVPPYVEVAPPPPPFTEADPPSPPPYLELEPPVDFSFPVDFGEGRF